MANLIRRLVIRFERSEYFRHGALDTDEPIAWTEWNELVHGAYELGFVSPEIPATLDLGSLVERAIQAPSSVASLELEQLRQILHFLVRSERWGDTDSCTGGGPLWDALCSGTLKAIADQLERTACQ
jgi:hypothetical protein